METLCGFRLSSVGMVIGWLGAIFSFIAIVLLSLCLSSVNFIAENIWKNIQQMEPNNDITEEVVLNVLIWVFGIYLALSIINFVTSVLLIAGTVKERHLLLLPWLFNTGIAIIFGVIYLICIVIIAIANSAPFGAVVILLISSGISLTIQYVIWSAIHSLFKQIRANREQQQELINASSASPPMYPQYTKM